MTLGSRNRLRNKLCTDPFSMEIAAIDSGDHQWLSLGLTRSRDPEHIPAAVTDPGTAIPTRRGATYLEWGDGGRKYDRKTTGAV